jgi:hypothetical protein
MAKRLLELSSTVAIRRKVFSFPYLMTQASIFRLDAAFSEDFIGGLLKKVI